MRAALCHGAPASSCRSFFGCRAPALGHSGFSGCGTQAELPRGIWDLPGSGIKPTSPALAGGFSTTELPGKSHPEAPLATQHRAWHSINICTYFIVYKNYIYIYVCIYIIWASLIAQLVKTLPAVQETWVRSPGCEDPLEEGMATHSSILTWRIPWTEEPGGLQSMGSQRVRHD